MKRRKAREYALQMLFEFDFTGKRPDFGAFWKGKTDTPEVVAYAEDVAAGAIEHVAEIDSLISAIAERWLIDRMAAVDRNILRTATYELLFRQDVPSAVVINEALEIAKKFSTAESASFINGILDKISTKVRP